MPSELQQIPPPPPSSVPLERAAPLRREKLLAGLPPDRALSPGRQPLLLLLAAGKGTRFGTAPKCVQPVRGLPLARHSIEQFRRAFPGAPCLTIVGYAHREVMAALGNDIAYVQSDNPTGGTAFAAYEALCLPGLSESDADVVITMGDRIVPESVFRRLLAIHRTAGPRAADLTFLSVEYLPPAQHGKGRILRDAEGRVRRIVEQRDIDAIADPAERHRLDEMTEGNCPLYVLPARALKQLGALRNDNAQRQYYLTDLIGRIAGAGGEIRTLTVTPTESEYAVLCSDVTRPADLARLESLLAEAEDAPGASDDVAAAAEAILADRSGGQAASIAAQIRELAELATRETPDFTPARPVAVGISGGRLRVAFMHPDMGRFFGPAWQMPTGAADATGREQITLIAQEADDGQIRHYPASPQFREKVDAVAADDPGMFPPESVADLHRYEEFGTRMAERLLLSLGYFSDVELKSRRENGLPLPPPSLWVCNSLRRPFSLICNAIASLRTLRHGPEGDRVRQRLGADSFRGLRLATTGDIPQGGFSSSSALTVAVKNALNALYGLGIPSDTLVHLACQAEYGTGVRGGSLDQATEQKGRYGQGALISSNPRENYRIIGVFPVPTDRYRILFPYSVDRDREAWRWSGGAYAAAPDTPVPTAMELRKLTGKSAEMAAVLVGLSPDQDFFPMVEADLVRDGILSSATLRRVLDLLRSVPLCIGREALKARLLASGADPKAAEGLLAGWREPCLRRTRADGRVVAESGVPLRAMLAYLFQEVVRNFQLIHRPDAWIAWVARSQRGDRCFDIQPERLPPADALLQRAEWEYGLEGPTLLNAWLDRVGARPFDFNRGLEDADLDGNRVPSLDAIEGGNFFRGLALIDFVEALLRRAFGEGATAVRINAAGQGDYFQVHVDRQRADPDEVKRFLLRAYYERFGLVPRTPFVEPHPGGGAVGVRLSRFDRLPALAERIEALLRRI